MTILDHWNEPWSLGLAGSNWTAGGISTTGRHIIARIDDLSETASNPIAVDGHIHLGVDAQAVHHTNSDSNPIASIHGVQGVEDIAVSLRRGALYFSLSTWSWLSTQPIWHSMYELENHRVSERGDLPGVTPLGIPGTTPLGVSVRHEATLPASELGLGPVEVQFAVRAHPRNFPDEGERYSMTRIDGRTIEIVNGPTLSIRPASTDPLMITGRVVSPNTSGRTVRLSVRDRVTRRFFALDANGVNPRFEPRRFTHEVPVGDDGNWSFDFSDEPRAQGTGVYDLFANAFGPNGWPLASSGPTWAPRSLTPTHPTVGIENPGPAWTGIIHGSAQDDRSIESVHVQIRDLHANRYWSFDDQRWTRNPIENDARIEQRAGSAGGHEIVVWSLPQTEPDDGLGQYLISATGIDHGGNRRTVARIVNGEGGGHAPVEIAFPPDGAELDVYRGRGAQLGGTYNHEDPDLVGVSVRIEGSSGLMWDFDAREMVDRDALLDAPLVRGEFAVPSFLELGEQGPPKDDYQLSAWARYRQGHVSTAATTEFSVRNPFLD